MIKDKLKDRLVDVASIIGSDIRDATKQVSEIIRNELTIEPLIKGIVAILCSSRVNAQMKLELKALDISKMTDKESIRSIIAVLHNHRANLQVKAELMALDAMIAEIEEVPAEKVEEKVEEKVTVAVDKDNGAVKEKEGQITKSYRKN